MFLIERSEYDDDASDWKIEYVDDVSDWKIRVWWWCFYVDDVSDRRIRVWWRCFWLKDQNVMMIMIDRSEYDDVAADWKVKVLNMLLIERSKCWRCCCWSNSQITEDVADRKVQVLKMSLLIERSKCWRCCCWSNQSKCWRCYWSKGSKCWICRCKLKDQNAEDVVDDEDWRLKMKTTWCWKASNDL